MIVRQKFRSGFTEQITLQAIYLQILDIVIDRFIGNKLGHSLNVQLFGKVENGLGNNLGRSVLMDITNNGTVNLNKIDIQAHNIGKV